MLHFTNAVLAGEDIQTQEVFFKSSMWIFGLDDLFDSNEYSLAALSAIRHLLLSRETLPLASSLPEEKQAIVHDLKNILQELLSMPALAVQESRQFEECIRQALVDLTDGMLAESEQMMLGTSPALEDYMKSGIDSLGLHLVFLFVFRLMEKDIFETADHSWLNDLLFLPGRICRLLNDKRSYHREIQGKKINSIEIIRRGIPSPDNIQMAIQQVDALIDKDSLQLKKLVGSYHSDALRKLGNFAIRVCETTRSFYAVQDFK